MAEQIEDICTGLEVGAGRGVGDGGGGVWCPNKGGCTRFLRYGGVQLSLQQ